MVEQGRHVEQAEADGRERQIAAHSARALHVATLAVVDQDGVPAGRVYRTHDGGASWTEEQLAGGLRPSVVTLSSDGKLLTSFDARVLRVYRHRSGAEAKAR